MLHLQNPLYISLKVPRKEPSLQVSLTDPLHRESCSISRALFTYLSKPPEKKPPSEFPWQIPYVEKDVPSPELYLHIFQSSQKRIPPPGSPLRALQKQTLHSQNLPLPVSQSPRWMSPPSRFPIRAPMERDAHHHGLL
jgi:hypothetical protein